MKLLIKLLLPLLLTGCAYKSFYHKPAVLEKNRWTVPDRNISNANVCNLPYIAWWHGFNDPTLNQLINDGLRNNNTINMSKGHIEAAEGELKKVILQWIPNIDLLLGYSRNPATGFPGFLALFAPSYTINIFNQLKEQKKARYELTAAKAEDDSIKLTIITQIAASYFTYLAEIEHKKLLKTLADDLELQANIASKVYKTGLNADIDLQILYSAANVIRGEQEVIERNIIVSRNALRYLINQNPGKIKTTQQFLHLNNKQLILGALPLTVLENRPDLQMAGFRLRASNEGIGLAASKLLPSLHFDLFLGPVAGNSRYSLPRQLVYFNDQIATIPALKLSVLGEIAKARGLDKVSYFNYIDTFQKVLRDTTNALSANDRLTNKLKHTEAAQRRLARAYNLNYRLYKRGIQNYVDTLTSKIALDKINIEVNQAKLQQLITIVNLYQELAGGYKTEEKESCEKECKCG